MDGLTEVKELNLNQLEWSPTLFKVSNFLNKFSLPQIVKVMEGFYGDDEESSLGADQVLTLHVMKSTDKIMGHDYRGKEVNIPLNCPNKVEVRPSNLKDVYESVDELCSVFPRHVRISQGYYSPSKDEEILNVGDKLCLKNIDKSRKGHELLICVNQNEQTIELPRDCYAGFQPLTDGKEYYLAEIVSRFKMPLYVQFVDPPPMEKQSLASGEVVFNSSLGTIYLENLYTENIVIASTIGHDGHRTVVTFPRDIDIRIAVCEGMLRSSTNYAQICRSLNNGMDLSNLKHIDAYSAFKPRNSVREYSYRELVAYATPHLSQSNDEALSCKDASPENDEGAKASDEAESKVEANNQGTNGSDMTAEQNKETGVNDSLAEKNGGGTESNGRVIVGKAPPKPLRKHSLVVEKQNNGLQNECENPQEVATAGNDTAPTQADETEPQNTKASADNANPPKEKVFVTTVNIIQAAVKKGPDVSSFSVKQVGDVLRELGMAKYVAKFEAEMIDGEMLTCLDDDILVSDFGMNKLHCMKLRKYLEGWRPKV